MPVTTVTVVTTASAGKVAIAAIVLVETHTTPDLARLCSFRLNPAHPAIARHEIATTVHLRRELLIRASLLFRKTALPAKTAATARSLMSKRVMFSGAPSNWLTPEAHPPTRTKAIPLDSTAIAVRTETSWESECETLIDTPATTSPPVQAAATTTPNSLLGARLACLERL